MAGADQGPPAAAGQPGAAAPGDEGWRDWAGLPEHLLMKVAGKLVARTEAGWAAKFEEWGCSEGWIQAEMAKRERDGNCPLFVLALVCKPWRKAQLGDRRAEAGGPRGQAEQVQRERNLTGRLRSEVAARGPRAGWTEGDWRRTNGEAPAAHHRRGRRAGGIGIGMKCPR